MDPITRAMQKLGDDAEAFWRANPDTLLPLLACDDQREDVVQALRLYEARPENRRPFVVFRAPYVSTSAYFTGLAEQIAEDFERVRAGVAAKGVELPSFSSGEEGTLPSGPPERAARAMYTAAHLLGERFAGVVVVLMPAHVADVPGWRESIRMLAAMRWSPRVRVAAFDPLEGPLAEVLEDGGVVLELADVLAFLEDLAPAGGSGEVHGAEAPSGKVRRLMLQAGVKMAAHQPMEAVRLFERARALCAQERLATEEVAALMGIGGACVAAQVPELAIEGYSKAAGLAETLGEWAVACHAWLGVGGSYLVRENHRAAAGAYRAAASAAKEAGLAILRIEALRMTGTCLLHVQEGDGAIVAWQEAVDVGVEADATERRATGFEHVARALVDLLEGRGLASQAQHVRALLKTSACETPEDALMHCS